MTRDIPRQPWIERAKSNIRDIFDGKRKLAFRFEVLDPPVFMALEGLAATKSNKCAAILDHKLDLERQLAGLRRRFEMGFEDDFVYRLQPYTGCGFFASALGCETVFPDNGDPITHKAISSLDELDSLRVDVKGSDLIRLTLDKIKYFLDETNGEVPIAFPDLQSPLDTASIVMDYGELMYSLLAEPKAVHTLLGMVTDAMEETLSLIGELLPKQSPSPAWWLPRGIWLSDDLIAVVSPQQYKDIAMPYANRLSDIYGGVALHSCGNPLAAVDVVREYHNLMALDFWEVTIRDFHDRGGDYICSCCVVEDTWHNLDRRAVRRDPEEAVRDALADLKKLPKHLDTPVLFWAVCPHPDYAAEYHATLSAIAAEANTSPM